MSLKNEMGLLLLALAVGSVDSVTAVAVEYPELEAVPLRHLEDGSYEGPLFEMIPSDQSGIVSINEYSHPEAWTKYWHQYYNGSIGTAIAIGDVNGDRLPDVYLVSKDSRNSLYINEGDFTFVDRTAMAGVGGRDGFGSGASFVDIDNDGDLDLYACYVGSSNQLFVNDGKGVFAERSAAWGLDIDTGTNMPSFADMDLDGDLDLYLQCNFLASANMPEGLPDRLLENEGERFKDVTVDAGINGRGQGHAAIWWDYNEDGFPDIYVANDFEPTDKLYRNNGDGTFEDVIEKTLVSSPYFGMGADLGDINNDGHIDFIVADMATPDHVKHHTSVGTQESYLLDISKSKISQYMKNMLSVKIGPDQFFEIAHLTGLEATGWTWAARLADLDNDGLLDAYFTNGMVREFHNADLAARLSRASTVRQRILNHENGPMLVERNLSFRNEGDFSFVPTSADWGLDLAGISFAAAFADFDLDGDLDLIINNLNDAPVLYRNRSERGTRVTIGLSGRQSNRFGIGARVTARADGLTQTRELSLTRGYLSHDEPLIHFAFPSSERIDSLSVEWPSGIRQEFSGLSTNRFYRIQETDKNSATDRPLREPLFSPSSIQVPGETENAEEFYDLFAKQPLVPFDETGMGPEIVLGDLDNDGWLDLVMGGATGQETRVFRNKGGTALELVESDVFYDDYDSEDCNVALFDYDGDEILDMLVTAGGIELDAQSEYYRDRVYLQKPGMEFQRLDGEQFDSLPSASRGAVVMDANGDGRLDLLSGGGTKKDQYPFTHENLVWIRTDSGYVLDTDSAFARAFAQSGKTMELLSVDIDSDGDLDLVQAIEWGSPAIWIFGEDGLSRAQGTLPESDLKGIWRSVASGDFNGDGRVDLVFGNLGQNTKYDASIDAPAALFSQVKMGRGANVGAYTRNGRLLPVESRNIVFKQFPQEVRRTTKSFLEYARMTVEEIFPNLASDFTRLDLVECRSLVLFQSADGGFDSVPLPRLAQTGVATDLLVADFNRDGLDDIAIAHEPLPPNPWAGRKLKGHLTLLLGKEDRSFEALLPWQSGLTTNAYPKRLASGDLDRDGLLELLVSQTDGPLLVFEQN